MDMKRKTMSEAGFTELKDEKDNKRKILQSSNPANPDSDNRQGTCVKSFEDVCELVGGSQPAKDDFIYEPRDGYIRLIQVRDYKTDKFITYIPKDKARRFCNKEDIMIGRYGPPIFGIFKGLEGAYNVALTILSCSTFRGIFSINDLKNMPFPCPPLEEQKAIIHQLDALCVETQRLEAIYQKKIDDLEELKKSILQKAFAGELSSAASSATSVTKVISLQNKVIPLQKIADISATDLQAGITAIALQKHIEQDKHHSFGHVKAEKIVHMAEYILNIDLERNPVKDAAGPNDFPHAKWVESRAAKAGFYTVAPKAADNTIGYSYTQGRSINTIISKTQNCLGERYNTLSQLLELMVSMSTQQAEITATVYAAWNNMILSGNVFSDEDIILEAREHWHESKKNIAKEKFHKALEWMKTNELLVPKGNGKPVIPKKVK